ncbi:hypothetical protein [Sagittula marina]|uniref:hypothetical protein n=1 Tax=Sagittula marina TaxID=943940 RepID=UPI00161F3D8E|nr:hypothetical protein [Sagittula marina]
MPTRLILSLVLAVALVAAAFASVNPATRAAQGYARQIAATSAGTYLTLRTLNAFLSTAQEVEVGGSLVVQGTAQPLKWLEPVDDTVERVAQVVFVVMVATGVLSVALVPVTGLGWAMLAGAAAVALFARRHAVAGRIARALGLYGVLFGAMLPIALILSSALADRMTAQVWEDHSAVIAEISADVGPALASEEAGGMMAALQRAGSDLDRYRTMAVAIYERSDELVSSLLALVSVFVFKLFVLPALLLGAGWGVLRACLRP